ncbi:MAG: sulfite exporter TauE/SafE family protein [Thermoanaerobaculaceae bacterium]|nr:sulfite exporter TauE/SafE family protein [Thermoanaerobaculaceae bacterium]
MAGGVPARSGIESISLWVLLGVRFLTGWLSGMLGVGGGFIRMPALVYILGCPTVVAVGTDLFEIFFRRTGCSPTPSRGTSTWCWYWRSSLAPPWGRSSGRPPRARPVDPCGSVSGASPLWA